jgi:hypothetical protein
MIKKYKTKPVEIEAIEFDGTNAGFIGDWSLGVIKVRSEDSIIIQTLEGDMLGSVGDFIIKGLRGEYYPCKPDVFHQKYCEIETL